MLTLLASLALGCSRLSGVSVGPVVARPPGIEKSYGGELRLWQGAGSSDGDGLRVFELEGRAAVTERVSAISVGLGPGYLHWLGPAALTGRVSPALGVQYFDRTVFASAGLHGGLGLGFALEESVHELRRWGPWMEAAPAGSIVRRERTLLTLELTAAVDGHVRGATLATGLLVGIAWSVEQISQPRIDPLPRFPFGWRPKAGP